MQARHLSGQQYFMELAQTSREFFIPYIEPFLTINAQVKILEIGCGEGGNLLPFAQLGCEVVGVDMASAKILQAREIFAQQNADGIFIDSDIFKLKELEQQFDLIILHDVIEHIDDKELFLFKIRQYLKSNGLVFVAFPAWQMPFGGHQQIARTKFISHFPFLHLLPRALYRATMQACGEKEDTLRELLSIKKTRCSIEKFLQIVSKAEYRIVDNQLYFINPHYKVKFGLKPVKLGRIIARTPYVRGFFATSCFYMLRAVKQ